MTQNAFALEASPCWPERPLKHWTGSAAFSPYGAPALSGFLAGLDRPFSPISQQTMGMAYDG
jgi:hypothetical protein